MATKRNIANYRPHGELQVEMHRRHLFSIDGNARNVLITSPHGYVTAFFSLGKRRPLNNGISRRQLAAAAKSLIDEQIAWRQQKPL